MPREHHEQKQTSIQALSVSTDEPAGGVTDYLIFL